jgi:formylglycine-generating enzyme required for sulfatase activity
MGSITGSNDEQPEHLVHLDEYWIGQTEVTNAQYALCVSVGGCIPPATPIPPDKNRWQDSNYRDHPVTHVDWKQATAYCTWAGVRLPTEAEWEKAASGTDGYRYPWGDSAPDERRLNYKKNVDDTTPVGKYPTGASAYGALDMAGNVWEWVNDRYLSTYYTKTLSFNPQGPNIGKYHVMRGGSWLLSDYFVRTANRGYDSPAWQYKSLGFRCVRSSVTPVQDPESPLNTSAPATATPFSSSDRVDELLIPAGEFVMGSSNGEGYDNERPQHMVYLDAYYIDKYEVTNARYQACVGVGVCDAPQESSSSTRGSYFGNPEYADYPVIQVSWVQAEAFCAWEGKRLPTEAEWEKAARGTDGRIYPWGNEAPDAGLLNYDGNVGDTKAVGSYPTGTSPYGVMDMAGNVWEWVNDWYGEDYYSVSPRDNPPGPETGQRRVLRGGSWSNNGSFVRSAVRNLNLPDYWGNFYGFRCVRSQ